MNTRDFTESVVEDAALAWIEALGYPGAHGPEIARGEPAEREALLPKLISGELPVKDGVLEHATP